MGEYYDEIARVMDVWMENIVPTGDGWVSSICMDFVTARNAHNLTTSLFGGGVSNFVVWPTRTFFLRR